MWKMTLKKMVKRWLRARILALLAASGAAWDVPKHAKSGSRQPQDLGKAGFLALCCSLGFSWALVFAFFAFFLDLFDRFWLDFALILLR